jgi:hypothetical protein
MSDENYEFGILSSLLTYCIFLLIFAYSGLNFWSKFVFLNRLLLQNGLGWVFRDFCFYSVNDIYYKFR